MADDQSWEDELTADEVVVTVCLNRALYRKYVEARDAADTAPGDGGDEQVQERLRSVVEAKAAVDAASRRFTFATLDWDDWQALLDKHPPTAEQRAENKYLDHNPSTFPQAAVQATCTDPDLSDAQADKLRQKLPRDEWRRLWEGAWTANVGGSSIPKSEAAIVSRLASELNSITRPPTASPSPPSEDDDGSE